MSDLNELLNLHDKRLRLLETREVFSVDLPDIVEFDELSSQLITTPLDLF